MEPGGVTSQAIKGETKADYSFFLAAVFSYLPPLGKLVLAGKRGKINKSNLKYAFELFLEVSKIENG